MRRGEIPGSVTGNEVWCVSSYAQILCMDKTPVIATGVYARRACSTQAHRSSILLGCRRRARAIFRPIASSRGRVRPEGARSHVSAVTGGDREDTYPLVFSQTRPRATQARVRSECRKSLGTIKPQKAAEREGESVPQLIQEPSTRDSRLWVLEFFLIRQSAPNFRQSSSDLIVVHLVRRTLGTLVIGDT